ncbi:ABC transporter permease [Nocardioides sp. TRM66260-LWL]|uniref:ABC transporter permease n=1 Tax=Nocardioides sp. TRM66260-LWL TaxID=2874478 RepID=UPI001CC3FA49|nr:ABC transporter permease [Nocardioides sp. TRM66260-LWL]MBZ5733819.1 ABC transporter permease [Nocardioides sp. TRM66260-LWL]
MGAYIVRRILVGAALLVTMSLVTFLLFFATPVDYARLACGKTCQPAQIEEVRKSLGYDDPVLVQWGKFMKGVAVGREFPDDPALRAAAPQLVTECPAPCLGYSTQTNSLVGTTIKERLPVSLSLALVAFILWIVVGVAFGVIAALRKGTLIDRGIVGIALFFFAFPTFFVGLFLYTYFAIKWQVFPIPRYTPIADGGVWPWLQNLLLPGATLALFYMAGYVRITRAFVLESMGEDYVRTARAKGLPKGVILRKHTMRAALTPLVTMAGLDLASLAGGAIITEAVFNYQGLGLLAGTAARNGDLSMSVGIVVTLAAFVIAANIIVDVLYAVIDPRVRVG